MYSHSIKDLWDLPQLKMIAMKKIDEQIFNDVMPIDLQIPFSPRNQAILLGNDFTRVQCIMDSIWLLVKHLL